MKQAKEVLFSALGSMGDHRSADLKSSPTTGGGGWVDLGHRKDVH